MAIAAVKIAAVTTCTRAHTRHVSGSGHKTMVSRSGRVEKMEYWDR